MRTKWLVPMRSDLADSTVVEAPTLRNQGDIATTHFVEEIYSTVEGR